VRGGGADYSGMTVVPAVGTVLYATLRNLPPFLVLGCVLGALGVDIPDGPFGPDALSVANGACQNVSVRRLPDYSGPFSDPPSRVSVDDLQLRITVDRTNHVVVVPSLPYERGNRLLLSLIAALLIVIAGLLVALVARRNRPQPPPGYNPFPPYPSPPYPPGYGPPSQGPP
jgi:hypothetical protein